MPWKESSVIDERMRFVIRLKDGESMASLCREFGISRKTGYKILDRYEQCGVEGVERSRPPATSLRQPTAGASGSGYRVCQTRKSPLGSTQDPRTLTATVAFGS